MLALDPNTDGLGRVDNIQKMLVGVLSVAALIALAVPQKNPLPEKITKTSSQVEALAAENGSQLPSLGPNPAPVQFDTGPTGDFQIGAPTIDGNPIQPNFGMPFGATAQSDAANPDAGQSISGSYTPTAFTMPGAPASNEPSDVDSATAKQ